ncbi:MAG: putative transport system permease protein [Abditibacteriota bacterium]|nr:putative transport system permease protein [Abditibacteriota bacterium]
MNLWENVLVALQGLAANKLRASLTMLGIIIGVMAVILGTAIGQGSREQVLAQIQALGSNIIIIFPGQQRSGAVSMGQGSAQSLTLEDAEAIDKSSLIVAVAPQVSRSAQVKYGGENTSTSIIGTTSAYPAVRNYVVERGRFFTDGEVRGMRKVCIVGKTTAQNLFGDSQPINKSLRIRGINFKIIGLMGLKGAGGFGDPDDQIYIPITTAMKQVFGLDSVNQIAAQTATVEQTAAAVAEIEAAIRKTHRLLPSADLDVNVRTQAEFAQTQEQAGQAFTFLLTGIAAVALLVGGIGIMNIMLVSVTERTREIGIRKAVGAKNANILFQFLIEAMTLSVLGGLIGIACGFAASAAISALAGWPTVIAPLWVGIAFFSSATIGIFFGIYPAYKAAQLDPIEALRYQ